MKLAQAQNVVREGWNGFNVLHTAAGRVGALDVCALPSAEGGLTAPQMLAAAKRGDLDVLFLVGAATTKDFSDMAGDKAGGCDTLPLRYGVKKAAWMITPFFVCTWYAPMCCVIPPASPLATRVRRMWSSNDVLPWST